MVMTTATATIMFLLCFGAANGKAIKNMHDNPEEHMNVTQIIKYFKYPCENHKVITEDGYILNIQRIPYGRKNVPRRNEVVYLQHGLLDSAATWVMNLPNQSFAFILADKGFDVWLGNSRGNTYSKKHVKYSDKDPIFWHFSFDEMAKYDLPATVNYILKYTSHSQLHYVGHSQGTTIGFIELSRNTDLEKKIISFHALAPVVTVGHIKGALRVMSNYAPQVEIFYKIFGIQQFFPSGWIMKFISEVVCAMSRMSERFCGDIMFLMTGFDQKNLNVSRIPIYSSHTPAGTSVMNIIHFVQMIKSGKFQMYDYGTKINQKKYNQPTPPLYNVGLMKTPVSIFSGSRDWLADPYDINKNLKPYLQNIIFQKSIKGWNHMDFIWGEDAHSLVFQDIINLMNKVS